MFLPSLYCAKQQWRITKMTKIIHKMFGMIENISKTQC